ncbi:hypothetical protein IF2G_01454 [Cordyceps javanica]|nr:hypothetical protein IF2G_01454 [Cordyceps javanica]
MVFLPRVPASLSDPRVNSAKLAPFQLGCCKENFSPSVVIRRSSYSIREPLTNHSHRITAHYASRQIRSVKYLYIHQTNLDSV